MIELTTPEKKDDSHKIVIKLNNPIFRKMDNIQLESIEFLHPNELNGKQIGDFFDKNPVDPKKPMDPKKQVAFLVFMCRDMLTPDDFDQMKAKNLGACNRKLNHMKVFNDFFQEDGEV